VLDNRDLRQDVTFADILSHPAVCFGVRELTISAEDGRLSGLEPDDLRDLTLAFAATASPEVNAAVATACALSHIPCNTAVPPGAGSFHVPAVARSGSLTVALSTGGASPALARVLKTDLEKWMGQRYSRMLALLEWLRPQVLMLGLGSDADAVLFRRVVERRDALAEALNRGDAEQCRQLLADILPPHFSLAEWLHELD